MFSILSSVTTVGNWEIYKQIHFFVMLKVISIY
jgi:hypothetical protein